MINRIITPYAPEDSVKKMLDILRQMNAKVESVTNRTLKAKVKIGFMASISIQANLIETPFGSMIEFAIPNLLEDQLVDEVFFGDRVMSVGQKEKMEKIRLKIEELKTCVDGLSEEEVRNTFGLHTSVKFLAECPRCGSNVRKGFRCAYCNSSMVKIE